MTATQESSLEIIATKLEQQSQIYWRYPEGKTGDIEGARADKLVQRSFNEGHSTQSEHAAAVRN